MGLSKHFVNSKSISTPENYIIENYAQDISESLILSLEETKNFDALSSENSKIELLKRLGNKYLAKTPVDKDTQVIIVDQAGTIISSNVKNPRTQLIFRSQEMLINFKGSSSNSFAPNQQQKLSLQNKEQQFLGVITSWQNQKLGLNWFILVAVPKSEQENNKIITKRNISSYLFLGTLLGASSSIGLVLLINKLNSSVRHRRFLNHLAEQEQEQKFLPSSKPSLEIATIDKDAVNPDHKDPYFLVADMSHELRSPLNAILGFAQIMEQELTKTTEPNQENIAIINRSGTRLLEIINDLVDLAKIETKRLTLERNKVNLDTWLDQIEQNFNFQATTSPDWNLLLIRKPNLPQGICIDERRLKQVLRNLIDYCVNLQPDANITLTVTPEYELPTVRLKTSSTSPQKLTLCFTIESSNCVVDNHEIETLFKPSVRVRTAHKPSHGSSLNLPLSRHLAQLMGGDITVNTQTSHNSGIKFDFRLKTESIIVEKLQLQSTVRRIIGLESGPIKYRILIVDDSKTNRQIMSHLLTPVGFEIQEAVNGKEAIDVWLRWQPHMIWMDLRMPVMNGYEATERIRSHASKLHTPIVGLSASTLEEEKSLFWAAGCDDFVGKPFSENIIFDKIAQHLGIRYVYESIPDLEPNNYRLTKDSFNVMPNLWLSQIEQAAEALNQDLIIQLLQDIPSENSDLKNSLQKLVNNFEFDRILSLAQKSKNN